MKAQDLAQAIRFFNPRSPLSGAELNYWFVERPDTPRFRLEAYLGAQREPVKTLFIGPRGSGKTTELNKLAESMRNVYYSISVPMLDITGRTGMDYVDLMLALFTEVTQQAVSQGALPTPLLQPVQRGWDDLSRWWDVVIAGLAIRPPADESSVQATLGFKLAELQLGVKQSAQTRERINDLLEPRLPEMIQRLNWVLGQLQRPERRVLLIVEGLDKIDLAAAESIFRDHAATIAAPEATMIFTFPNALRFSDHFDTIRRNFARTDVLPNFAVRRQNGTANDTVVDDLRGLVWARLEERLADREALDLMLFASGGQLSSLVFLVQNAAVEAVAHRRSPQVITAEDAQEAIRLLRSMLAPELRQADYALLRERHRRRRPLTADADEGRLLYNGTLLEYGDGQPWGDAHPVLWELLEHESDDDPDV